MRGGGRSSLDARLLIARSVALQAEIAVEIARARELRRRSSRLRRMAVPIAGGSDQEVRGDGQVTAAIVAKLHNGHLPRTQPSVAWAARGDGRPCDACDQSVPSDAIMYEVQITSLDVYHFHVICFGVWSRERERYLP